MKKPSPPTDAAVQVDLQEALRRLGVGDFDSRRLDDLVYEALVAYWRKHNKPPRCLWRDMKICEQTFSSCLRSLETRGLVLHPRHGLWVPVVRK